MDDDRQRAFRIALDEALRDRAKLDATIEFLSAKLGTQLASSVVITNGGENGGAPDDARAVGPIPVTPGEFHRTSSTAAARTILERAGKSRPLKTADLFGLIERGGVRLTGKHARSTFYRTLNNDPSFERVAPSTWGLTEWYRSGAAKKPMRPNAVNAAPLNEVDAEDDEEDSAEPE